MRVVTTTTVFADIVQNVGGEHVDVVSIIPPGVGPEDYEPRPEDAQLLQDADLIVSNGVGLDDFLQKLLARARAARRRRLVLGDGIPPIDVDGEQNPHFWLDPTLVGVLRAGHRRARCRHSTRLTLPTSPPTRGYAAQLDALDTELKADRRDHPAGDRKLVTFHDAFPYLAQHYRLRAGGVILANVGRSRPRPSWPRWSTRSRRPA